MVGRGGRAEPFVGEIFKAQMAFRADRAAEGYHAPGARGKHWVAGGCSSSPSTRATTRGASTATSRT